MHHNYLIYLSTNKSKVSTIQRHSASTSTACRVVYHNPHRVFNHAYKLSLSIIQSETISCVGVKKEAINK